MKGRVRKDVYVRGVAVRDRNDGRRGRIGDETRGNGMLDEKYG